MSSYHFIHFSSDCIPLSIIVSAEIVVLGTFSMIILFIYHCLGFGERKASATSQDFGVTKSLSGIFSQVLGVGIEKSSLSWITRPVADVHSPSPEHDIRKQIQRIKVITSFILKNGN